MTNICINCKTKLEGPYCYNCGEKIVTDKDFTLKILLEQTVDVFTHIDSKLITTLKFLLFKPGKLSEAYVMGLRKPFMKPFQIFILINILFFLLLANVDIFRIPSSDFFNEKYIYGYNIIEIVEQKIVETNKPEKEIAFAYDLKSTILAKTYVIILIPLLSFVFSLLFIRKKLQIGKHLLFSTHLFSFLILIIILWLTFFMLLPKIQLDNIYLIKIPLLIIWVLYMGIAIKRFYKSTWFYTIVTTFIGIVAFMVLIDAYRTVISLYSLLSIN